MDFNFKSKLWGAGSIFHQFESMCQEVDGFVNKEAMKFVGDQVQSVGMSVKRLYSDVVQDILPLSGDTAKPERQLTAGKEVDVEDRVTNSTYADEIKLVQNQVSVDHEIRSSKPADVAEVQNRQDSTKQGNDMVQNSEDSIISAEKNDTTDLKPATANSSFDGEIFSGKSEEDISSSPAISAHEEDSTVIEEERRDFNHQKGDEGFSGDTMCLSDTLTEQGTAMVQNSEDSIIISGEKNDTTDLKPVTADSSFYGETFCGKFGESISSSPAFSAIGEGSTFIEEERRDFNHQKGDEGFSGDTMHLSDTLTEQGTATVQSSEDSIISAEKNDTMDLKPVTANSSCDGEIFSGKSDEALSSSPEFSAHEGGSTFIEEERRDFNHQKGGEGFSGDTMCLSGTSTEQGTATVQNSEDSIISAEKNYTTDLKPVTANSSFHGNFFSGESEEDTSSSSAFSVHEEGSIFIKEERRDFNNEKGDEGVSSDTIYLSDTSSTSWSSDSTLPMIDDLDLDVNGSFSSAPVPLSTHNVYQYYCPLMDSPVPPACDVDDGALSTSCCTKDDSVDLSTSVQSSEHVSSYSCDEKEDQTAIMPSTSCTSPKSSMNTESTSADFSNEAANVLLSRSVSDVYSPSASSMKWDLDPAFLMMESNENNILHTEKSDSIDGSLESGHEEHYKNDHSKIVVTPSGTENTSGLVVPIGDLDLENVDLSSNVKHDGRNVTLYSHFPTDGSYTRRNFRYYKKLIQGAFTSQKRLTKEYEHLAIMYGDLDLESDRHLKPSSLSSFPDTALHAEGTQSSHEMSENEWELL